MKKTSGKATGKTAKRADSVLPDEELDKAVKEYLARRQKQSKQDGESEEQKPAPVAAESTEEPAVKESETHGVEQQTQEVRDNRDRRDTAGDPKNMDEAMNVIAEQDEDINTLFDIIDSLLAKLDFHTAETSDTDVSEQVPVPPKAEEEPKEDCDDSKRKDDDDTPPDSENPDEEDEEKPPSSEQEGKTMNSDSIDHIVRERIELGSIGRMLNMDGLENVGIMEAKKAIINAVQPEMRLDGKSAAYINGAYSSAVKMVRTRTRKGADYQRHQMFNRDSHSEQQDSSSAKAARERMIDRMQKKGDQ